MDYYAILEIKYGASQDEIRKAFHRLAHVHHPDKGGDVRKFQEINNAYQELKKNAHAGSRPSYEPPRPPDRETSRGFWYQGVYWQFDESNASQEQMEEFMQELMHKMAQDEQFARNRRMQAEAMRNQQYSEDIEKKRQAMADMLRDTGNQKKRWGGTSPWR